MNANPTPTEDRAAQGAQQHAGQIHFGHDPQGHALQFKQPDTPPGNQHSG